MNDFLQFAKAVWRHSISELTSSAAVAALSVWEHWRGYAVTSRIFLAITVLLLIRSFFKAWRDEHQRAIAADSQHALHDAERKLAEANLEEINAQKKQRQAEEEHAERIRVLTAPDSGIRHYANQRMQEKQMLVPFTVEQLVAGLKAPQADIEEALAMLRSRGQAKQTSLYGTWVIYGT